MKATAKLKVIELGRRGYAEMVAAQERLVADRLEGRTGDLLLLLEHPPTYTLGRRSEPSDLLHDADWYRKRDIEICETPRGGKVTYHGPGQIIVYPIIDLREVGTQPNGADRVDVATFVATLEQSMADAIGKWGLTAGPIEGLTGVWVDDDRVDPVEFEKMNAVSAAPGLARGSIRKIGSIGLKVTRGVTSHGLSLNVSGDLKPFEWINSCGIENCRATSIEAELGRDAPRPRMVSAAVAEALAANLDFQMVPGTPGDIGLERRQRTDSVA
jgi:lipoyl(octanoyl) transferase